MKYRRVNQFNIKHKGFAAQLGHFPMNFQGDQGWTLLHWAVHKNQIEITQHLLKQKNINVTLGDKEGFTPFMCAAAWGYLGLCKIISDHHSDSKQLDQIDHLGWSALTWACSNGHIETVIYLLQAGANPNLQDYQLNCPLHRAAKENNIIIAQLLVTHGADATKENSEKETPVKIVKDSDNKSFLKALNW